MLALGRRPGETIHIMVPGHDPIIFYYEKMHGNNSQVRMQIDAPKEMIILRGELIPANREMEVCEHE